MSDLFEPDNDDARKHERDGPWRRRLAIAAPAVVLVGLLAWGFLVPREPDRDRAPDFELALLDGGSVSSDELRGDPVVLNFWASWCIPCREEMPAFERMWKRYRDEGIQVIGVNVQDSRAGAREFVAELDVTYPIAVDADDLASELGVRGLPQTFFIDEELRYERISSEGALAGEGERVVFGAIDEEELEAKIRELLAGSD